MNYIYNGGKMKNKLSLLVAIIFLMSNVAGFAQDDIQADIAVPEEQPAEPIPQEQAQAQASTQEPPQPNKQALSSFTPQLSPAQSSVAQSGDQNKISLDIKGMDIVDVLKMLATRSGMNIVVGKNVSGRVTLFLKNVDIWDAFELILLANDLAYETKGGIINVMTQRDYELIYGERYQDTKQAKIIKLKYAKAADLSRALTQIKTNLGRIVVDEGSNTLALIDTPQKIKEMEAFIKTTDLPIQTRVFSLSYAQADKLQPKIQEALTKGVGAIRVDERTNKIVISDYPERIEEIAKIITAFDEKNQQVLIDAQIIQIQPSDAFKMGVDWDYWLEKNVRLVEALPSASGSNFLKIGTAAAGALVSEKGEYKGIIDILRTIGDTQILSSPRIIALNNQEAKILVGKKQSYGTSSISQGGSGNTVTAIDIKEVESGIKLYVTPTINRDGFVTMKIRPEISDTKIEDITVDDKKTSAPNTTTSESETTVMVKDGVTVIIGGLKKETRTKTVAKIPVLGDIPGIGFIFRRTSDTMEKDELVILITPHILTGENSYSDFSEIPPREGAIATMTDGQIRIEKVNTSPAYNSQILQKIQALALFERPAKARGQVKLSFTLSDSGILIDEPKVIETSNAKLNMYAIKAIKDAAPFQHFPDNFNKTKETFNVNLSYE